MSNTGRRATVKSVPPMSRQQNLPAACHYRNEGIPILKFFHLSDLHLGIRLYDYNLHDDQVHILNQITAAAGVEQPDAVVIAGDVFDKANPGPEAVALFSDFVVRLKAALPEAAIMIISGNHDNGERINLYRDILKIAGVHVAGRIPAAGAGPEKVRLTDEEGPVDFYLLPFVRPGDVRHLAAADGEPLSYEEAIRGLIRCAAPDPGIRTVLVAHQFFVPAGMEADKVERMDSELTRRGNVDAVSASVLAPFNYAALGHIHKPTRVTENAFYCGTPLSYSLSERGQQKSIRIVDLPAGRKPQVRDLPLRPLREVRRAVGSLSDVTSAPSEDYVEVILSGERNTDRAVILSRLRQAFPNLLGYRFAEEIETPGQEISAIRRRELDPLELCFAFLGQDADVENRRILTEIIRELEVEA